MVPTAEPVSAALPFKNPLVPPPDEAGWEALVHRHEGAMRFRVLHFLERLGQQPGRDLIDEILQDVYCRLFEHALRRWRGSSEAELLAYLGTIVERTAIDHLRMAQADKRNGFRRVHPGRRIEAIPDPRNPELDLLHAEAQRLVLRRSREQARGEGRRRNIWVARMAILEGWTNQEIASRAGGRISPANVASLIHRLRKRLQRQGFGKRSGSRRSPLRPWRRSRAA